MPRSIKLRVVHILGVLSLFLSALGLAAPASATQPKKIPFGAAAEFEGVIVERTADFLTVRHYPQGESRVIVTPSTRISEKKKNPFRDSREYSREQLLLGLKVEVSGHGDRDGALIAEQIKFTQDDFETARTIESTVSPIENGLDETRKSLEGTKARLSATEEKLEMTVQKVEGDLEELEDAFHTVRGEAESANQKALKALVEVDYLDRRVDSLDDYSEVESLQVQFDFNSADLPADAKPGLDRLIQQYRNSKGFLLQVTGFASADGNEQYNRRLSQNRAAAVVAYLTETGEIPLRRIVSPYGFGENNPIADNGTVEGRRQNRRVEIKVLVNRGLSETNQSHSGLGSH